MNGDPTAISLLVPYAGPAHLLRETVRSVQTQSDPHWELLVVEDGEQDATISSWLRSLDDERIRYERNSETLGIAANFQRCLDLARTDWLTILGSDDRLGSNYVEIMRAAVASYPAVSMVQPGVRVIDDRGRTANPLGDRVKAALRPNTRRGDRVLGGDELLASLLHGNWAYFPSLCWRRDRLADQGFRQDLDTVLDLEVLGRLILSGAEMLLLDQVAFDYRRHSASASALAAMSADRFREERLVAAELGRAAAAQGWASAHRAAHMRLTSRLHALSLVPAAVRDRQWSTLSALTRHLTAP